MKKTIIYLLIPLFVSALLLTPYVQGSYTTSAPINSSGNVQINPTSIFTVKSAAVQTCNLKSGNIWYASNWASVLHNLGVNTLRLQSGGGGDSWHTNMVDYAAGDAWAYNLNSLLSLIDSNGFKCYFQDLGDPYSGGIFGIDDMNLGDPYGGRSPTLTSSNYHAGWTYDPNYGVYRLPISLETAKTYIDKLAGNNALGKNFLTDSRVLAWTVGNECYVGTKNSDGSITTNNIYTWIIGLEDYMRTKGAQIIANSPLLDARAYNGNSWYQEFSSIHPLFEGHADYIEYHQYGLNELLRTPAQGGFNHGSYYDWAGWKSWLQNDLATQIANRGSFPADHVIMGEFGIWHGYASDGGREATFSDQNVIDYYNYYFQALTEVGTKWTSIYAAFLNIRWNMVTNTNPAYELAGCEPIRTNYAN